MAWSPDTQIEREPLASLTMGNRVYGPLGSRQSCACLIPAQKDSDLSCSFSSVSIRNGDLIKC